MCQSGHAIKCKWVWGGGIECNQINLSLRVSKKVVLSADLPDRAFGWTRHANWLMPVNSSSQVINILVLLQAIK